MVDETTKTVLTIAGSDPTGGAGIQADLRTFNTVGVEGVSVIAALTAQDSSGVQGVFPVDGEALALQLETLFNDRRIHGVKTGMLLTAESVRVTARVLKRCAPNILVIDPVIRSSNGVELLEDEGVHFLREELLPLASVVTPNLSEAEVLSGISRSKTDEEAWIREMGQRILALGPQNVVITGGHRTAEPVDLLFHKNGVEAFSSPRASTDLHGSGCILSSALCGYLALEFPMNEAVRRAKGLVLERFLKR